MKMGVKGISSPLTWFNSDSDKYEIYQWIKELYEAQEEKDSYKSCDQIFAMYLIDMAAKVVPKFYKVLTVFAEMYRQCMNRFAYDVKIGFKRIRSVQEEDFTKHEDATLIPMLANTFLTVFLPSQCPEFDKSVA